MAKKTSKQENSSAVKSKAERWVRKMGHHHHHHTSHPKYSRYDKPRQEISKILKYIIFFSNFFFAIVGIVFVSLGGYLYSNALRPVLEAVDLFLNPAVVLIAVGVLMILISLMASIGALRENVCMLKSFALCLFVCYIGLVIFAFVLFILFYSDSATGVSMQSILLKAVHNYHDNENLRDFMDYVQTQLSCCGATSQGFKDWGRNAQYNCSSLNIAPEQCGVPYSCCKSPPPAANSQSVSIPTSFGCGFDVQKKALTEVQDRIFTDGCLNPLQRSFEGHAVIIGAVVGIIIIPVCLSVTFANILAKQIERQRYLLDKEQRKEERRKRRQRSRFRDPFATVFTPPRRHRDRDTHQHHDETNPVEPRSKDEKKKISKDEDKLPAKHNLNKPKEKDKDRDREREKEKVRKAVKSENRREGKSASRAPRERSKNKRPQQRKISAPAEQKQTRKVSNRAISNDRELDSMPPINNRLSHCQSNPDFTADILSEPIYSDVDLCSPVNKENTMDSNRSAPS